LYKICELLEQLYNLWIYSNPVKLPPLDVSQHTGPLFPGWQWQPAPRETATTNGRACYIEHCIFYFVLGLLYYPQQITVLTIIKVFVSTTNLVFCSTHFPPSNLIFCLRSLYCSQQISLVSDSSHFLSIFALFCTWTVIFCNLNCFNLISHIVNVYCRLCQILLYFIFVTVLNHACCL